jgi:hypothetical protein
MSIRKSINKVGDAAQAGQTAQQEQLHLGREQVHMGREQLYGSAVLGALLAVALILLIVLEFQWIRYWGRKLTHA